MLVCVYVCAGIAAGSSTVADDGAPSSDEEHGC